MLTNQFFPQISQKVVKLARQTNNSNREVTGIVTQEVIPHGVGQVKFCGSWWNAISDYPASIPVGCRVRILYPLSLPLQIEPM